MDTKKFTVRFYAGSVAQGVADESTDDNESADRPVPSTSIAEILSALAALAKPFTMKTEGNVYFLKLTSVWNQKQNFSGVFGKLRMSGLPHISDAEGNEQELNLEPYEGLVEKNFFIYTGRRKLLIYQESFFACTTSRFGEYLTRFSDVTVSFSPIIKADTLRRFMRGEVELKKFDISVARPTNPAMFPDDDFSTAMLNMMNSAAAATLGVHMSANMPGARGSSFLRKTKQFIGKLVREGLAKHATVEVKEGGKTILIDLIADQISAKRVLQMQGRYPDPKQINEELEKARQEVAIELNEHFGSDNEALG